MSAKVNTGINGTVPPAAPGESATGQLRLRMDAAREGRGALDGAWWPYSRRLSAELPALVTGLNAWLDEPRPGHGEHVSRIAVSLTVWTSVPGFLDLDGRRIKLAWFGTLDANTISVSCPNNQHLDLLVVPPETSDEAAENAMTMAADAHNTNRGSAILARTVPAPPPAAEPIHAWTPAPSPETAAWETEGGTSLPERQARRPS